MFLFDSTGLILLTVSCLSLEYHEGLVSLAAASSSRECFYFTDISESKIIRYATEKVCYHMDMCTELYTTVASFSSIIKIGKPEKVNMQPKNALI